MDVRKRHRYWQKDKKQTKRKNKTKKKIKQKYRDVKKTMDCTVSQYNNTGYLILNFKFLKST